MNSFKLRANGRDFGYFTSGRVSKTVEALVDTFDLTLTTERDVNDDSFTVPELYPQTLVEVFLNDTLCMTGHIFKYYPSINKGKVTIKVSGRSKTAGLVDCNVVDQSGQFKNIDAIEMVKRIIKPFNYIKLENSPASIGKLKNYQIQDGDTAYESIRRGLRLFGYTASTSKQGNISIEQGNAKPISGGFSFREGVNCTQYGGGFDDSRRFSHYQVKGQSKGDNDFFGDSVSDVQALAKDLSYSLYRPKIIFADGNVTTEDCRKMAQNESMRHFGKSRTLRLQYPSWFTETGVLLDKNQLVFCYFPSLIASRELLITSITYSIDGSGGCYSDIVLQPPEAIEGEVNYQPITQPNGFKGEAVKAGKVVNSEFKDSRYIDAKIAISNELNENNPDQVVNDLAQAPYGIGDE